MAIRMRCSTSGKSRVFVALASLLHQAMAYGLYRVTLGVKLRLSSLHEGL
jgi:hypothetical protein